MSNKIPEWNQVDGKSVIQVSDFFGKEFTKLVEQYPTSYSQEDLEAYLANHTREELSGFIANPEHFLYILRDDHGEIFWYFESKKSIKLDDTHVIQWWLIKEEYQGKWFIKKVWTIFLDFCHKNNIKQVISFASPENTLSISIHEKNGFHEDANVMPIDGLLTYKISVAKILEQ